MVALTRHLPLRRRRRGPSRLPGGCRARLSRSPALRVDRRALRSRAVGSRWIHTRVALAIGDLAPCADRTGFQRWLSAALGPHNCSCKPRLARTEEREDAELPQPADRHRQQRVLVCARNRPRNLP